MTGATVYRRNGPPWRFEWDHSAGHYIHRTKRGTAYAIFGVHESKPIWIGRMLAGWWITDETRIGAYKIEFDGAGEYWFEQGDRK